MDVLIQGVLLVVAAAIVFAIGAKYGRGDEQEFVGRVLAECRNADAAIVGFVQTLLGSLKREYTEFYDEAIAEAEKLEKEL